MPNIPINIVNGNESNDQAWLVNFNNLVNYTITGGTYNSNSNTLFLNQFNGSNIVITGFTSSNSGNTIDWTAGFPTYDQRYLQLSAYTTGVTSSSNAFINNEAYSYSSWSGDTISGATRQALANKINDLEIKINTLTNGQSVNFNWKFDSSTSAANPGNGQFRSNSTTASGVTQLYISSITNNNGLDIDTIFSRISGNWSIYIQQVNNSDIWVEYTTNSTYVNNGGWWTLPVTYVQSGIAGNLNNNTNCVFYFINENGSSSSNVSLNNEAYSYASWSGDTVSGATRQAIANKFNSVDTNLNSVSAYTLSLSSTTQNLLNTKLNINGFNSYSAYTQNLINTNTNNILSLSARTDIYTTGATLSNGIVTFTRNDNNTYSVNLNSLSGNSSYITPYYSLTDSSNITIDASLSRNFKLISSFTSSTININNSIEGQYLDITLTGLTTSKLLTFPAQTKCINSDGTTSGNNTCLLSGIIGDTYRVSIAVEPSNNYKVASKNFG